MNNKHTIKFDDEKLAPWAFVDKEASVYSFVEAIVLSGLEGQWLRLSAGMQRNLIGFPVFGKQEFRLNADGTFTTYCKVCFGQDWETMHKPQSYIGVAARRKEKLSPRYSGKGYFSVYAYENNVH